LLIFLYFKFYFPEDFPDTTSVKASVERAKRIEAVRPPPETYVSNGFSFGLDEEDDLEEHPTDNASSRREYHGSDISRDNKRPAEPVQKQVEKYPCSLCNGRLFLTASGLESHARRVHEDQVDEVSLMFFVTYISTQQINSRNITVCNLGTPEHQEDQGQSDEKNRLRPTRRWTGH